MTNKESLGQVCKSLILPAGAIYNAPPYGLAATIDEKHGDVKLSASFSPSLSCRELRLAMPLIIAEIEKHYFSRA